MGYNNVCIMRGSCFFLNILYIWGHEEVRMNCQEIYKLFEITGCIQCLRAGDFVSPVL